MADKWSEAEMLPRFIHSWMKKQKDGLNGLDTGFPRLNRLTHGLGRGIYVLGGKPGCGKTTLAWQIAFQVALRNEALVVLFSLDQGLDDLRVRLLSRQTGIESELFYDGRLKGDDEALEVLKAALEENRDALGRLCLKGPEHDLYRGTAEYQQGNYYYMGDNLYDLSDGKDGPPSLPAWLLMEIESMKKEAGTRDTLLVVDYVQKMYPLRKHGNDYERLNIAMDELRKLSERIGGPVLVVSEINRENYESPGLDAFKNSGRIEYAADVACVLHERRRRDALREMELRVLKNRMGDTGVIEFDFYPALARFEEVG